MALQFTDTALDDLRAIQHYYQEKNIPEVGDKLVQNILAQVEILTAQPELGRIVPEFEVRNIRELIRPPFRIVYRLRQADIFVIRVWRSERLMKPIN